MPRLEAGVQHSETALTEAADRFSSPEEELAYLRERVRRKEAELESERTHFEKERIAKREVVEYQDTPGQDVLRERYQVPQQTLLQESLRLEPEDHDTQIDELLRMIPERGIKNTLDIARKLGSAHIEDDVHRAIVRYIAEGLPAPGVKEHSEEWKALNMALYEVSLSTHTDTHEQRATEKLETLLASMEQFYAGLLSVISSSAKGRARVFSLEIAVQQGSEEAVLYVAVPRASRELFERHVLAVFPEALVEEARGDYNIFTYGGAHAGAYGVLKRSGAYPLKDYTTLTHDPLNVMLSAFAKLAKHGEGAAIQCIVGDHGDTYNRQYKSVVDNLRQGKGVKKAIRHGTSPFAEALDTVGDALFKKEDTKPKEKTIDELSVETITRKLRSRVVPVNVRILASAADEARAGEIVDALASTFNQFEDATGNAWTFVREHGGKLQKLIHGFIFRTLNSARVQPLSLTELTTMYHLGGEGITTSRELKQTRTKRVAAPLVAGAGTSVPAPAAPALGAAAPHAPAPPTPREDGVILGKNIFGGSETLIHFKREDRMRHFYEIGQTGTGKTNLMKNMIIQDIHNGEGCCYIDPHGSDIVDILAAVPPERADDVIYFDPAHVARPMGLNIMEFNPAFPEQKTFVVNEIFSIFEKLFGDVPEALGPMFQQYFRNAAMLVLEGMEPGTATMADIPRVLANTAFRRRCIANSRNPVVNQFWEEIAEKAGGEASLENIVPYITSKTDIFLGNEVMRPIIAQEKSAFNFRDIMDSRKILLVNLSKGRLGDLNAELLGLIIVGKFLQAALSRVDALGTGALADFYLYIDEFQNFTTPSIATILSEARKYRLSLNVAHQFIAQLDERIRDAVFGNVGTKCVFRVSTEDAEVLEKQFQPEFSAADIVGLDNFNAYLALLIDGKPAPPFNIITLPPAPTDPARVAELAQRSYERYGRPKEEVEAEIAARFAQSPA